MSLEHDERLAVDAAEDAFNQALFQRFNPGFNHKPIPKERWDQVRKIAILTLLHQEIGLDDDFTV